MGDALARYAKHSASKGPQLSAQERSALRKLRAEARQHGAELAGGGKGGLPPSLVLGVMRRDEFRCKVHGDRGEGNNGGLQVHHKGGIVESHWLSEKGHSNDPNNIVTLCTRAHDAIHNKARAEGVDSSQVEPEGDHAP
jgi:hypothetical protein